MPKPAAKARRKHRGIPYKVRVTWSDGEREGSFWVTFHKPGENPKKGIKNAKIHEK